MLKIVGTHGCMVGSASWLTKADEGRGSIQNQGIVKPFVPLLASDSSPTIFSRNFTTDCFKYGKFCGVENFSDKLIINTTQCCVSA